MSVHLCCNPLKKEKHNRVYKNVSLVTEKWKANFTNLIGKYICDSCRRAISKKDILVAALDIRYIFCRFILAHFLILII